MFKKVIGGFLACAVLILAVAVTSGSLGSVLGADAPEAVTPESCAVCHKGAGDMHQASYSALYKDGVIKVTNVAYSFSAPNRQAVTFKITKNGVPFNINDADSWAIGFAPYNGKAFQFDPVAARVSLKGTATCDAAGLCTSTVTGNTNDFSKMAGLIAVYGTDEVVGMLPARVSMGKYPFVGILETGAGVDYVSTANATGCEKCHTTPYLKHGYIYARANGDPTTDFLVCKTCHLDNGPGGHLDWQLLVDDPKLATAYLNGEVKLTAAQQTQYAYKTRLMNDVHMSHAMEFPYPQSMANCVTCHDGKLDKILTDANFKIETCKSCHPVTGAKATGATPAWDTTGLALTNILPKGIHGAMDLNTVDCGACHGSGKMAKAFNQIHTGYNDQIYTASGQRYSDAIKVTIDSASVAGNKLNIKFSATESPDLAGVDATQIVPTVLVGLYGWDTKNFLVGPHERLNDDNKDGKIDSADDRTLEAVVGAKHARLTTVSSGGGKWEVTADLSAWADLIASGQVRRAEIGVIPTLKNAKGDTVALDAPSRTFNIPVNKFEDGFYAPVVKTKGGCNDCHDALATTFHSPDRGGNVVICRLCHTTTSGGGHLQIQSRSIDSYVHAIHSFQAFDMQNIDFSDPFQALEYKHHTETTYPAHGTDCESCHLKGTYNVPNQDASLPGILSASSVIKGKPVNIKNVPSYITGPASRACGGCHRAELISEDSAVELVPFMQHTKAGGYLVPVGSDARGDLVQIMKKMMSYFY